MKRKLLIIICLFAMLATIGVVYAALTTHYDMPQTATPPVPTPSPSPTPPPATISASFQVNGSPWTNNTVVSWGQLVAGANTKTLAVTNTGTVAIALVSISNGVGFPVGWSETITMGTAVGSTIPCVITLNADASVSGLQSWTSSIILTSP
jgi:hypothetical protein